MLVLSSRAKWRDAPMPARRGDADRQGIADRDHQGTEGLASDQSARRNHRIMPALSDQSGAVRGALLWLLNTLDLWPPLGRASGSARASAEPPDKWPGPRPTIPLLQFVIVLLGRLNR